MQLKNLEIAHENEMMLGTYDPMDVVRNRGARWAEIASDRSQAVRAKLDARREDNEGPRLITADNVARANEAARELLEEEQKDE